MKASKAVEGEKEKRWMDGWMDGWTRRFTDLGFGGDCEGRGGVK